VVSHRGLKTSGPKKQALAAFDVSWKNTGPMNKLEINYVSTDSLRPYAGNARTHSKNQIRQIADSIERFGFANPNSRF
jgi:hypothetical protein